MLSFRALVKEEIDKAVIVTFLFLTVWQFGLLQNWVDVCISHSQLQNTLIAAERVQIKDDVGD